MKIAAIVILVLAISPSVSYSQSEFISNYFSSNGAKIHYIDAGVGEAVVLLHGNTGSVEAFLQTGIFQKLADNYHVIAMDARGHGESDKPHSAKEYGIEMSNDVIRLLDHLDIQKAHVIGFSMGARILAKAITTNQDRFISAILGGFAPVWDWTEQHDKQIQRRYQNSMNNPPPQRLIDEGQDTIALATLVLGFSELAVTSEELAMWDLPVLSIVGSEDFGYNRVIRFKELMPDMELVIIDGGDHSATLTYPQFLAFTLEFLAK